MQRLCKKCLQTKDLSLFEKSPACLLGHTHRCLECKNRISSERYYTTEERQKKREKHKKHYPAKYQATAKYNGNWEYYFKTLLTRKDRRELTTDSLMELLEKQGGVCAVSGVTLTCIVAPGQGHNNTNASIDRILPGSLGGLYEIGNVRLVCGVVNKMRGVMSDEELHYWCGEIMATKKIEQTNNT